MIPARHFRTQASDVYSLAVTLYQLATGVSQYLSDSGTHAIAAAQLAIASNEPLVTHGYPEQLNRLNVDMFDKNYRYHISAGECRHRLRQPSRELALQQGHAALTPSVDGERRPPSKGDRA